MTWLSKLCCIIQLNDIMHNFIDLLFVIFFKNYFIHLLLRKIQAPGLSNIKTPSRLPQWLFKYYQKRPDTPSSCGLTYITFTMHFAISTGIFFSWFNSPLDIQEYLYIMYIIFNDVHIKTFLYQIRKDLYKLAYVNNDPNFLPKHPKIRFYWTCITNCAISFNIVWMLMS